MIKSKYRNKYHIDTFLLLGDCSALFLWIKKMKIIFFYLWVMPAWMGNHKILQQWKKSWAINIVLIRFRNSDSWIIFAEKHFCDSSHRELENRTIFRMNRVIWCWAGFWEKNYHLSSYNRQIKFDEKWTLNRSETNNK